MGVNIRDLIQAKSITLSALSGKIIGIDGYNVLYQFLSRIRRSETGEPLRDSRGRVTSHLSGLFYRTSNLVESGIKPLFVWDGTPPKLKEPTLVHRKEMRKKAEKKWAKARAEGKRAMVYAQAASKLTDEMVRESTQLLDYMGIPSIHAPSEGEAQLASMALEKDIWASASQDWDSLLFNSSRLVRNLSISGRRKLPRKRVFIEVKPELVELTTVLNSLEITREQLIIIGILIGTDYNPGVKGIGPKTALRLVKKFENLDDIVANVKWTAKVEAREVLNFFLNPPITKNYELKWTEPNTDKLVEFMVIDHDFSRKRVEKVATTLKNNFVLRRRSLESYFG
jgi:flap endonuclease-1